MRLAAHYSTRSLRSPNPAGSNARRLVLHGDLAAATAVLAGAVQKNPDSVEARCAYAGLLWQAGESAAAESMLRTLLACHPQHAAATFLLAKLLEEQARMRGAEIAVESLFRNVRHPFDTVIQAVELLDECGRKRAAADLCENKIAPGTTDPRLHACAGTLDMQVGRFERAR